jgi:hypothetical protein
MILAPKRVNDQANQCRSWPCRLAQATGPQQYPAPAITAGPARRHNPLPIHKAFPAAWNDATFTRSPHDLHVILAPFLDVAYLIRRATGHSAGRESPVASARLFRSLVSRG